MENLKDRSTAELLAEWERLDDLRPIDRSEPSKHHQQCDAIAAELDRRCSEAGIKIENCRLRMDVSSNCGEWRDAAYENASVLFYLPPADLRDLLTWLLLKGGNG